MTTVAFDLDETFLTSAPAMAAIMMEETGAFVSPDSWDNYNLAKVWMASGLIGDRVITNEDVMGWFVKHNLMERCRLADGAMETYEFCRRRKINIEFVTARGFDPMARARTMNMLRNSGVHGGYDLTIVPDMNSKHPHMKCKSPLAYVDDNAQQVLHLLPHTHMPILMAQPHNLAFRQHDIKQGLRSLPLAHSMWDVLDVLTYLNATVIMQRGGTAQD